ncbi:MAG: type II secretion system F family protein [Planctomycetaceae bacterium]|nr:type II secretion system F family protein [Planctomycetaceae bacterium]
MLASVPPLKSRPEFSGILKNQDQFGTGRDRDTSDRINSWFDTLMLQAGLDTPPATILLGCIVAAVTVGGIVFVVQENFLTAAFGLFAGFLAPILALMGARARRQNKIMSQIPAMLEELARAAKTGRSVEHSVAMVAEDTPAPLGDELRLVSRRLQMGIPLRDALVDLPSRTGLMTLNLLNTTLAVQQQTGGDLVTVLNRLSRTVRDRLLFLGRLRAATAASRATAVLMIVLPLAVLAFFVFRDPNYMNQLLGSEWGRTVTILGVVLEIIGSIWVLRILKDSQQT